MSIIAESARDSVKRIQQLFSDGYRSSRDSDQFYVQELQTAKARIKELESLVAKIHLEHENTDQGRRIKELEDTLLKNFLHPPKHIFKKVIECYELVPLASVLKLERTVERLKRQNEDLKAKVEDYEDNQEPHLNVKELEEKILTFVE